MPNFNYCLVKKLKKVEVFQKSPDCVHFFDFLSGEENKRTFHKRSNWTSLYTIARVRNVNSSSFSRTEMAKKVIAQNLEGRTLMLVK